MLQLCFMMQSAGERYPDPFKSLGAPIASALADRTTTNETSEAGTSPAACDDACLIACAAGAPACAHVWAASVPDRFTTRFTLRSGAAFNGAPDQLNYMP